MKKALQIASVASMIDQFNRENIKILQSLGYKVDVAANFNFGNTTSSEKVQEFNKELQSQDIDVFNIEFDRNIFSNNNIKAYLKIKKIINRNNYDIIHCHSPIGGVLTRMAAINSRKKNTKVIYTGHGFHFYKGAPVKNWILYYPIEFICSFFTDVLITINSEDYNLANKYLFAKKNEYVKGIGIDISKFQNRIIKNECKKEELGIRNNSIVLLSVGELSKRKNHSFVIKALSKIKEMDFVYLICGKGSEEENLRKLCEDNMIDKRVKFLGYRKDINEICKISDIFIFPSLQEGLPVALMEAMASGITVIASDIRGNNDLIENYKGGILFELGRENEIINAIKKLCFNKELRKKLSDYNLNKIKEYDCKNINNEMRRIYESIDLNKGEINGKKDIDYNVLL